MCHLGAVAVSVPKSHHARTLTLMLPPQTVTGRYDIGSLVVATRIWSSYNLWTAWSGPQSAVEPAPRLKRTKNWKEN